MKNFILELWKLQYFMQHHYDKKEPIHAAVAKYGTPMKLVKTNGKYYPLVANENGVLWAITPTCVWEQWLNLDIHETTEVIYYDLIGKNREEYKANQSKRSISGGPPVCFFCRKEFRSRKSLYNHNCEGR